MAELNDLEQEQLDERLRGAEHVPLHQPYIEPGTYLGFSFRFHEIKIFIEPQTVDEEEELRQLQASMAM